MQRLARVLAGFAVAACFGWVAQAAVTFSQSAPSVEAYDFVEITVHVDSSGVQNPFTEASVTGSFGRAGSSERLAVDGFCDSADGPTYRIRFMPASALRPAANLRMCSCAPSSPPRKSQSSDRMTFALSKWNTGFTGWPNACVAAR